MFAKVAVEAAVYQIDKPFTYIVPTEMTVSVGCRVSVPFGGSDRTSEGIILALSEDEKQNVRLKTISSVLDEEPVADTEMLKLAAFLSERYFCTFYDALKAVIPSGLAAKAQRILVLAKDRTEETACLTESEEAVVDFLETSGGSAAELEIKKFLQADITEDVNKLKKKGFLRVVRQIVTEDHEKTIRLYSSAAEPDILAQAAEKKKKRAPVQAAVLNLFREQNLLPLKLISYYTGASGATLLTLEKQGFLKHDEKPVSRRTYQINDAVDQKLTLTADQQFVYDRIRCDIEERKYQTSLLYGITGSGKTAVYIALIRNCLDQGKSAVLLVPEISLTPQLVSRLSLFFGQKIAVIHSGLSTLERADEWKRIRNGEAVVVIGTRSAVFAPVKNPGIFIIDEEHDSSYKSENTPRYHARDVAQYRCAKLQCPLLLGSATPSVETMYAARMGRYKLYTLKERYNRRLIPNTIIVDMKEELRAGNSSPISNPLKQALLSMDGHQAMLFLNRRGSAHMLLCVECGESPNCPNCSTHLTYHQVNSRLMCHYCGYSEPASFTCPACGGHRKVIGFGTQRVQTDLEELFPSDEVLRMDADTVSSVNSHETILNSFRSGKAKVLVGTQMITKGHDFPNVTTVGVLDADSSLYIESYRAAETTFSILTQVIGRCGRGDASGTAYIQTMTPENPVIELAGRQDYDAFYDLEIARRQLRNFPPFADIAMIWFTGKDQASVENAAGDFSHSLLANQKSGEFLNSILGPAPAPVPKVSGNYRYRLTIVFQNNHGSRMYLSGCMKKFLTEKKLKEIRMYIDVNPYD